MFFNSRKEYKITGDELNKVRQELEDLKKENENLRKRCNYEHLVRELDEQKNINSKQSNEIQKLISQIDSLNKTMQNERYTLKAVLQTLNESSKLCETTLTKYNITKQLSQLESVSLLDIKG